MSIGEGLTGQSRAMTYGSAPSSPQCENSHITADITPDRLTILFPFSVIIIITRPCHNQTSTPGAALNAKGATKHQKTKNIEQHTEAVKLDFKCKALINDRSNKWEMLLMVAFEDKISGVRGYCMLSKINFLTKCGLVKKNNRPRIILTCQNAVHYHQYLFMRKCCRKQLGNYHRDTKGPIVQEDVFCFYVGNNLI